MKVPLAAPERLPANVERVRNIVAIAILVGFLFAAATIGSNKSERAHRALDTQYQQCIDRWGFGSDNFAACLRHDR